MVPEFEVLGVGVLGVAFRAWVKGVSFWGSGVRF